MADSLKQSIKDKARQLGFTLAGVTTPEPPPHYKTFENWITDGKHGEMSYLASEKSRFRRADPKLILPECKSILVLAIPYHSPFPKGEGAGLRGRIASYAVGDDYHNILPEKLKLLVTFIEEQVGHPIPNRYYTDTGPILERDLAQRAGLGWIGKNTCLINPRAGSYFLLAEILLGIELEPDSPFVTDHCGTCTRCIEACPTECILPDRTLDARRCISYLTIELKNDIPEELRPLTQDWIFGCDICQTVCPWNRFAVEGDPAFATVIPLPTLTDELGITPAEFNGRFKKSPVKRAKRRGYLRNVAVAIGNNGDKKDLPALEKATEDNEPMVREHAKWAIANVITLPDNGGIPRRAYFPTKQSPIRRQSSIDEDLSDSSAPSFDFAPLRSGRMKNHMNKLLIATNNKGKVAEIQALLVDLNIELVTPNDIGLQLDVHEDGNTYAENASKKALAFAKASGLISLADDSGLEVDALDGAPGLYSARYSPKPGAKDQDRRAFLLQSLKGKPRPWTAHFHATLAIATVDGNVEIAEGQCPGEIIPNERGTGGFGYDPIFLLKELGKTMAELSMEEKNRLSHRAHAVQNAKPVLRKIFGL